MGHHFLKETVGTYCTIDLLQKNLEVELKLISLLVAFCLCEVFISLNLLLQKLNSSKLVILVSLRR